MDISVIIPAFNNPDLLVRCLSSLNHQTTHAAFDICVVDDGSGLDGAAICASAACEHPVIWRTLSENRGRSAARNTGIEATTGSLIVFLDADMEASPEFLEAHYRMHQKHPRTAGIGIIRWPDGGSFHQYIGSRGIAKLHADEPAPPWYFVTGNASIERRDLPTGPVFDESLTGWGGEDLDLGMRLAQTGIAFRPVPEARTTHHFSGTLDGHVSRTESYGRHVLPVLIERYPELSTVTRVDRLKSPLMRLLVNKLLYRSMLTIAVWLDALPLPALLFDYLTFAAYARGYLGQTR